MIAFDNGYSQTANPYATQPIYGHTQSVVIIYSTSYVTQNGYDDRFRYGDSARALSKPPRYRVQSEPGRRTPRGLGPWRAPQGHRVPPVLLDEAASAPPVPPPPPAAVARGTRVLGRLHGGPRERRALRAVMERKDAAA